MHREQKNNSRIALAHKKFLFKELIFKKLITHILVNAFSDIMSYYSNKALIKYCQCVNALLDTIRNTLMPLSLIPLFVFKGNIVIYLLFILILKIYFSRAQNIFDMIKLKLIFKMTGRQFMLENSLS